jgi:cellulose synthase/poly-beta-1,6-N-acetylglucosamine synthase-like glycosyltransferase
MGTPKLGKQPFIEIIIIFKNEDPFVQESIQRCLKVAYPNFQIVLLPDSSYTCPYADKKIRVIPTGEMSIPAKRNFAIRNLDSRTKYVAFIDSDAFPDCHWLSNALRYFTDESVAAVGGPNLTPSGEPFRRKVTGYVLMQPLGFGAGSVRNRIGKTRFIEELPTCNLIVKRNFLDAQPFDETLLTGEDAKFCSDMINSGYHIVYAADVLVFHHRRKIFLQTMKAFYNYGYYKSILFWRGEIRAPYILLPPLFLLFMAAFSILSLFFPPVRVIFLSALAIYLISCLVSCILYTKSIVYLFPTVIAIFLCHLSYGFAVLNAFIKKIVLKSGGPEPRTPQPNR